MKEYEMSKLFAHARTKAIVSAAGLTLSLVAAQVAWPATTGTQSVEFTIANMHDIALDAALITLAVTAPAAGSAPTAATATSSYDITTNASANGKRIEASINGTLPDNVELAVSVAAPTDSGTSQGFVALSSTAAPVVLGLQGAAQSDVAITYRLTAPVTARATTSAIAKTVTFTVIDQ
jgi:hypothetical protein